jgi:hypothetical protein
MQFSVICHTTLAARFVAHMPHPTFRFCIRLTSPAHRFRLALLLSIVGIGVLDDRMHPARDGVLRCDRSVLIDSVLKGMSAV